MITRIDCPERTELQQAMLGLLDARMGTHVEDHLSTCEACAETAAGCCANDDFIDALRAQPRVAADLDNHRPLLDSLIGRLSEIARIALEPTCEVASDHRDTLATATPASDEEESLCDFLAPPLGPDELGRLGPYRIFKILGAGGMGIVFEAEDAQLKRRLAIKTMKPRLAVSVSARRRFVREAQAAASVEHDNIVPIYQVGEECGVPFIAMPLLRGQTLSDRLSYFDAGQSARPEPTPSSAVLPLPIVEVLRIGGEIAQGLAAAHEHGLVHRDIKPANIWLEAGNGRAKILDFGLARSNDEQEPITQAGALLGTPSYMSPEQARGEAVDHRTDLFSLGCVLYHMVTGVVTFARRDAMATLLAVTQDQPKPPSDINRSVSDDLSRLILQLLAKNPADRPQSAQEVLENLRREESRLAAGRQSAMSASEPPNRRWFLIASAAAAATCMLAVIITIRHKDGTVTRIETDGEVTVTASAESGRKDSEPRTGEPTRKDLVEPANRVDVAEIGDEAVAEWVHEQGGSLTLIAGDKEISVGRDGKLPAAPYSVNAIDLYGLATITGADLDRFCGLAELYTLTLADTSCASDAIARLSKMPGLGVLNLAFTPIRTSALVGLSDLPTLHTLVVDTSQIDDDCRFVAGIRSLRQLMILQEFTKQGPPASLADYSHLRTLYFYSLNEVPASFAEAVARKNPACRVIVGNGEHTRVVGHDPVREAVRRLHEKGVGFALICSYTQGRLKPTVREALDDEIPFFVQVINLANAVGLTDAELKLFTLFDGELQNISAAGCHGADLLASGLAAAAANNVSLTSLWLNGSDLSDVGLAKLHTLRSLRSLVVHLAQVTPAGVKAFQEAVPRCCVVVGPAGE